MIVKVKICGIRTIDAATAAVDAGADFLGFNFVPTSKRYIDPLLANKIIQYINTQTIKTVGVFQNADVDYVNTLSSNLGLDFVQLHGSEDNVYIKAITVPVIKSITLNDFPAKIQADYFILDRTQRGEGEMIDFKKAARLATNYPIFYAGGLNLDNVANVIKEVQPFAVDVAGGLETKGHQDLEKIKLFISRASCHSERPAKNLFKNIDCHVARKLAPRNDNCKIRNNATELI